MGSGDLVGGRYPLTYPASKAAGMPANATQPNLAARSNLEYLGVGGLTDTAAALVSGEVTVAAVPVEVGDPISLVDVLVGATAAGTPTHSWAALYNAAGALVGTQSADGTTSAIAASARFTFTLGSTYVVSASDAPNGWLYVALSVTATTVPSLITAGGTVAAAGQYAWFTGTPAEFAATGGSALGATAPATLPSLTAKATPPVVFLR